ncbi:serine/threonine protein kinase [Streptomyces sp. NPDC052042]|uniref:serine/threonine protein kinase n=1 Tax=Streptomyces sp. NPDC052042 TaxID=3365683 RepID=UPI0037CCDF54
MNDYAGRVLADRYRLPLPPSDGYELVETRAFDTYSGQEVLIRQVPLPEVVDAEVIDADGPVPSVRQVTGRAVRRPADPAVRRAVEAAQAAAGIPDHPRLDQVFDVFADAGSLWIVSEFVAARPLAALLAERPLDPFRAAEIGSDVLTALRVLHAHGWTHRNITVRTVLICDDGRVVLTGLAAGAAEEALCGYVSTPRPDDEDELGYGGPALGADPAGVFAPPPLPPPPAELPSAHGPVFVEKGPASDGGDDAHGDDEAYRDDEAYGDGGDGHGTREAHETLGDHDAYRDGEGADEVHRDADDDTYGDGSDDGRGGGPRRDAGSGATGEPEAVRLPLSPALPAAEAGADGVERSRAERAGAIAAYREGTRAAARISEERRRAGVREPFGDVEETASLPVQRPAGPGDGPYGDGPYTGGPPADGPFARGAQAEDPYSKDPYTEDPYTEDPYSKDPSGEAPHDDDVYGYAAYGDETDDYDGLLPPSRRMHLTGTWSDGTGAGQPVPAGGGGEIAARTNTPGPALTPVPPAHRPEGAHHSEPGDGPGRWDDLMTGGHTDDPPYRGPATPLAAERARQARIAVVGAVTERWAPEQGGPVHANWRLAPPIGPATDLWALGALLYRAVQGHAPYPEENAAELVQMVCGEPPAFAEECGPLRPVVESLLRQDPTDRPDVEELSGWLRSLVRSAPEPEAGVDVVPLPAADAAKLPIVRRRGELVRRRRGLFRQGAAHGRHRQTRERPDRGERPRAEQAPRPEKAPRTPKAPREPKGPKALRTPPPGSPYPEGRSPRRLGRLLLLLILLALIGAVGYAVLFMPKADSEPDNGASAPGTSASGAPQSGSSESGGQPSGRSGGAQQPQTTRSAVALDAGYTLRRDPEGFEVGVRESWRRTPANADRQIRYEGGGFTLLVVPGRDSVEADGDDPLVYQADRERELRPFRESNWSGSSGLRRIDVGRQAMAEGQFTWQDANGREVCARNLALIVDGRYHVIQVIGPEDRRDEVADIYQQAVSSYRVTR